MSCPSKCSAPFSTELKRHVDLSIAVYINDPDQKLPIWTKCRSKEYRNLQDYLQEFSALDFALKEDCVLLGILNDGCAGQRAILAWLICEAVPRFQQSTDKIVPLETTVQSLCERASRLEADVASLGASTTATHALSTMLADGLRALKQKVKENHEGTEFDQPVSQGADLAARVQALESKMEELQPPISMLSDASESSACTLTPASTVVIDSNDERADFEHTEAATVASIHLHVAVYTGDPIGCLSSGRRPIQRLIVRMYPHTPFNVTVKPSTPSSTGILTPASSTIEDKDSRAIDSDTNHDQHQANADELSTRTMPSNTVSWNKLIQFADDKHLLFPRCPSKILELYQAVHQNASLASDRQSSKSHSISSSTLMSQQRNLVVLEIRGFPGDQIKMFVRMRRDNTFKKLKDELREEYLVPESCSLTWRHSTRENGKQVMTPVFDNDTPAAIGMALSQHTMLWGVYPDIPKTLDMTADTRSGR